MHPSPGVGWCLVGHAGEGAMLWHLHLLQMQHAHGIMICLTALVNPLVPMQEQE